MFWSDRNEGSASRDALSRGEPEKDQRTNRVVLPYGPSVGVLNHQRIHRGCSRPRVLEEGLDSGRFLRSVTVS